MGKRSKRSRKKRDARVAASEPPRRDIDIHPVRTCPKGYWYRFHKKHHYPTCEPDQGCWLRSISRPIEFAIFEEAVAKEFSDEKGDLYNIRREGDDVVYLGDCNEQVAHFWNPHSEMEWHGYPYWPIHRKVTTSRKKQINRPPKEVLQKMVDRDVVSRAEMGRLLNGDVI